MDIAHIWRSMRTAAPHAGTHLETAEQEISINVAQECRLALPSGIQVPEVSVTVTSNRPGADGQVTIGANFNSPDGSYQGPTKRVGQGQFTSANSQVYSTFVVLPSGWPVLGVGAEVIWTDGSPHSITLTYEQIACDPWVWWRWLVPVLKFFTSPFS